jgi:hypothetical protein
MPIVERKETSQLVDSIDDFLSKKRLLTNKGNEYNPEFLSIIEFIDRFKLLPNNLFAAQKMIIKCYYNIPLDDKEKLINISDKFNTKVLYRMTELEYLKYLFDQGRCNIKEQDGNERRELVLAIGRRSGKTLIAAIIAAYELYKLLRREFPQGYYGLPQGNEIIVLCVASDKDQAALVYNELSGFIEQIDYFKSARANFTQTYIKFRTSHDNKVYNHGKGTIRTTFKSSIAKGLRGRGVICVILDELAHFVDDGITSAEKVYKAIVPSIGAFSPKDPKNKHIPIGPSDGRVISISSPDTREGFFYRLYQMSLENSPASKNMLMFQAPTWEINPTISSSYYQIEYHKDPRVFFVEHGAEFSDRVRGWIENPTVLFDCIDPNLRPRPRGIPREYHFVGLDLGLVHDGTCVAITRIHNGAIELIYHEVWYAGKTWKECNPHLDTPIIDYVKTLQDIDRLDMNAIAEWLQALSRSFFIYKGLFDQWSGIVFEQELHKRGLHQFEMRNFFASDASQMYQTFKMFMYNKQFRIYDYPLPEKAGNSDTDMIKHSPLITELLQLQATSTGKNIITVAAPDIHGKHDDQSDALARSILLASEFIKNNPNSLYQMNSAQLHQSTAPIYWSRDQYMRNRGRRHDPRTRVSRVLSRMKRY